MPEIARLAVVAASLEPHAVTEKRVSQQRVEDLDGPVYKVRIACVEGRDDDRGIEVAVEVAVADLVTEHELRAVFEQLLFDQAPRVKAFFLADLFEGAAVVDTVVGNSTEQQQFLLSPFACAVVCGGCVGRTALAGTGPCGASSAVLAHNWPVPPGLGNPHKHYSDGLRILLLVGQRISERRDVK